MISRSLSVSIVFGLMRQRQRQSDDDDGIVRACSLTSAPTIYVFSPTGHPCKERLILTASHCKKYTMKKSPSNPCRKIYITPFNFSFWNTWNEWEVQSWSVFPRKFFSSRKTTFLLSCKLIYIYPYGGAIMADWRTIIESQWSGVENHLLLAGC